MPETEPLARKRFYARVTLSEENASAIGRKTLLLEMSKPFDATAKSFTGMLVNPDGSYVETRNEDGSESRHLQVLAPSDIVKVVPLLMSFKYGRVMERLPADDPAIGAEDRLRKFTAAQLEVERERERER